MANIKITFFMIVIDPSMYIADYVVKSYKKIDNIPFKLLIYSNWVSTDLKQKYFPEWRKLNFVEIIENTWQEDNNKPKGPMGPFEGPDPIWDRELKNIESPYHATVDSDFEILDAKFIGIMLNELDANHNMIAMSTDYGPTNPECFDSYSNEVICLNERWSAWFCIYKREALKKSNVSHKYYEEIVSGPVRRNVWDDAGYFQKSLKDMGFKLGVLDKKYKDCYIHYGAFTQNRDVNEKNVSLYRKLALIQQKGIIFRNNIYIIKISNYVFRYLAGILIKVIFKGAKRNIFRWND